MTVWQNEKAAVRFAPDLANDILNVGFAMHLDWDRLYPQQRRARINRLQIQPVIRRGLGIEHGSDSPNTGYIPMGWGAPQGSAMIGSAGGWGGNPDSEA